MSVLQMRKQTQRGQVTLTEVTQLKNGGTRVQTQAVQLAVINAAQPVDLGLHLKSNPAA